MTFLDRPLGVYLDKEFTDVLTEEMEANNITIATGETVERYEGDGRVQKVVTDKKMRTMLIWSL